MDPVACNNITSVCYLLCIIIFRISTYYRLIFITIICSYVPSVAELYPAQQAAGANINTNSWGSPFSGSQFYFGSDVDKYLYQNPSVVILFAAGNFGGGTDHVSSLSMEASSKNIIAVGSSESTYFSDSITNIA